MSENSEIQFVPKEEISGVDVNAVTVDSFGRDIIFGENGLIYSRTSGDIRPLVRPDKQAQSTVFEIVAGKYWYTTPFQIGASTQNLADTILERTGLHILPHAVKELLIAGFSFGLTPVYTGKKWLSLAQAVKDEGFNPYAWTVGDKEWQETKYHQSGLSKYIPPEGFLVPEGTSSEKTAVLLEELRRLNIAPPLLIVVDDKLENLQALERQLPPDLRGVFTSFHFKPENDLADANYFFHWLRDMSREKKVSPERVFLAMDVDNVLLRTNEILFGVFTSWLASLVQNKDNRVLSLS